MIRIMRLDCNKTSVEEIVQMIKDSGFTPVQRTTLYEVLRVYNNIEAIEV